MLFQRSDLQLQLFNLVIDAQQVFIRSLQAAFRLFFSVAVTRNTRRFVKDFAAVRTLGGNNVGYSSLPDDGISVPSKAGIKEQGIDILQAHLFPVDIIFTLTASVIPARQLDFRAVTVKNAGRVINNQRDLGKTHRRSQRSAAKDHIFHFAAAQCLRTLFAHNPENCVAEIALPCSVGADYTCNLFFKSKTGFVRKRLEPLNFQRF